MIINIFALKQKATNILKSLTTLSKNPIPTTNTRSKYYTTVSIKISSSTDSIQHMFFQSKLYVQYKLYPPWGLHSIWQLKTPIKF